MSTCRGCGGVIGRDCWNEEDCMMIAGQQQQRDDIIAQLTAERNSAFLMGVEFGYKQCEKGNNLQAACGNALRELNTINHNNEGGKNGASD